MTASRRLGVHPLALGVVAAYVVGLGVVVLGPWGWGLNRLTVRLYVFFRNDWPVAPLGASPDDYGVILNILLFVPLGACLAILTGRLWSATLLAMLCSAAVEAAQGRWLERVASWSDVGANSFGAFLGALGAMGVSLLVRRGWRRAGRPSSPRPH